MQFHPSTPLRVTEITIPLEKGEQIVGNISREDCSSLYPKLQFGKLLVQKIELINHKPIGAQ